MNEPADALVTVRLDELARLSALAASYWHSIELAADRGDSLTVAVHLRQVAAITRTAFEVGRDLAPKSNESIGK